MKELRQRAEAIVAVEVVIGKQPTTEEIMMILSRSIWITVGESIYLQ